MTRLNYRWVFIVVLLPSSALFAAEPADRYETVVNRMVKAFNEEDFPRIQEDFAKIMSDAMPLDKSNEFFKGLKAQFGKITKLDPPRMQPQDIAIFPAHFERTTFDIKIVLDNQDKIIGLWFLPHTASIPVPEKHETAIRLPFQGDWMVFWGGDTKEENAHHDSQNQRYALDFVIVDGEGKTHKGEGMQNEDYYAFGSKVLAPADGEVTDVIQGVRENQPGSMNPDLAPGNSVEIQHKENEVSVLAHFKQDSILVKVGDKVRKGQVLGLCGNSGNSSEPHIHYHLQNRTVIQDSPGIKRFFDTGIKCFFDEVVVTRDGKSTKQKHYSPVKGDVINPR